MPEITVHRCDNPKCNAIIEKPRDVYRIYMKGEEWREGPPSSDCQNVIKLGFCAGCAGQIIRSLQAIEGNV